MSCEKKVVSCENYVTQILYTGKYIPHSLTFICIKFKMASKMTKVYWGKIVSHEGNYTLTEGSCNLIENKLNTILNEMDYEYFT